MWTLKGLRWGVRIRFTIADVWATVAERFDLRRATGSKWRSALSRQHSRVSLPVAAQLPGRRTSRARLQGRQPAGSDALSHAAHDSATVATATSRCKTQSVDAGCIYHTHAHVEFITYTCQQLAIVANSVESRSAFRAAQSSRA